MKNMKKKRGKYLIKYSTGVADMMGETETTEAIAIARKESVKDPNLQLVEITDSGGCVISWKPRSIMEILRDKYWKILAFLYSKLRRLIAIGQTLG